MSSISVMRWLQVFTSTLLLMSVSGFDFENDTDVYSSKAVAFEKCEEWKDKGNVVVYNTNINIAEEASRFNIEHPKPSSVSFGSTIDKLKQADRLYDWNQSVKNFLTNHPSKEIKVNSRICDYEPDLKMFVGYENRLIQEGTWKDEDGMRGKIVKVIFFRY